MHLFVDISSHGFGHLAITAPVLDALAKIAPNLRLTVRTRLARQLLVQRIHVPFELIEASTDFGYVMIDATHIDLPASAAAYRQAHADWPGRVSAEARFLASRKPDLVLTNVSYLPLAGAALAGVPSLNWADLFAHFFGDEPWAASIHAEMLAAYRAAQSFLRVTPGMPMPQLGNVVKIGPIAAIGQKHELDAGVGVGAKLGGDQAILIAMGGIAHRLPLEQWPRLPGLRWLVAADWHCQHPDAIAFESFGLNFSDLLCSVDAVITKPGYGTFTEAACNGTPVLYQRRTDWPEQDCLIEWLGQHGNAREVAAEALQTGELAASLGLLRQQAAISRPQASGAAEAAAQILSLMAG
ncbi:MAG: hypothetical protein IPJ50_13835 [Betaproteobacteria bacterium]|nr:hypothetical protein [Betaproteobacteria bacterium]